MRLDRKLRRGDLVAIRPPGRTAGRLLVVLETDHSVGREIFSGLGDDGQIWRFLARHQVLVVQRKNTHTGGESWQSR